MRAAAVGRSPLKKRRLCRLQRGVGCGASGTDLDHFFLCPFPSSTPFHHFFSVGGGSRWYISVKRGYPRQGTPTRSEGTLGFRRNLPPRCRWSVAQVGYPDQHTKCARVPWARRARLELDSSARSAREDSPVWCRCSSLPAIARAGARQVLCGHWRALASARTSRATKWCASSLRPVLVLSLCSVRGAGLRGWAAGHLFAPQARPADTSIRCASPAPVQHQKFGQL